MSPNPLSNFDFEVLDDPAFREDAVREMVAVPLLTALGYGAPPHIIVKRPRLYLPFVYVGPLKAPVATFADYLLQKRFTNVWTLHVTPPDEVIGAGERAQDAYVYATSPGMHVDLYGLCNGRHLVIFHTGEIDPVVNIELKHIGSIWPELLNLIGAQAAWPDHHRPDVLPDLGIALRKTGLDRDPDGKQVRRVFENVLPLVVFRLDDDLYSLAAHVDVGNLPVNKASFDFRSELYQEFLAAITPTQPEPFVWH
jgi:hypothetical protein